MQKRSKAYRNEKLILLHAIFLTGKILSCVNIDHVGDEYTLNASQGVWPNKGFCRVLSAQNAPDTKTYMISVDFYVPKVTKANAANFLGVLFNAEDQNNFEFIYFR